MSKPNQTLATASSRHRTNLFYRSFGVILEGTDKLCHLVVMSIRSGNVKSFVIVLSWKEIHQKRHTSSLQTSVTSNSHRDNFFSSFFIFRNLLDKDTFSKSDPCEYVVKATVCLCLLCNFCSHTFPLKYCTASLLLQFCLFSFSPGRCLFLSFSYCCVFL